MGQRFTRALRALHGCGLVQASGGTCCPTDVGYIVLRVGPAHMWVTAVGPIHPLRTLCLHGLPIAVGDCSEVPQTFPSGWNISIPQSVCMLSIKKRITLL